jgi:hypothetical protein
LKSGSKSNFKITNQLTLDDESNTTSNALSNSTKQDDKAESNTPDEKADEEQAVFANLL